MNAMDYHGTTALHLACQRGHGSAAVSQRLNRRKTLAVIHATSVVAKRKPEMKISCLNGIQTHDLCDTGAVLYQMSYQANWELVIL